MGFKHLGVSQQNRWFHLGSPAKGPLKPCPRFKVCRGGISSSGWRTRRGPEPGDFRFRAKHWGLVQTNHFNTKQQAKRLVGWLVGRLVGRSVGSSVGRSVGCWFVGELNCRMAVDPSSGRKELSTVMGMGVPLYYFSCQCARSSLFGGF